MFTIKEFLSQEVKPALGCTEPGAVALAAARAKEALGEEVLSVKALVSGSIYKNGATVGIPGTDGLRGNGIAAALGALSGKSSYGLEVLKDITQEDKDKAKAMVENGKVSIEADMTRSGIYVKTQVFGKNHRASCTSEKTHTGIVQVERDGKVLFQAQDENGGNEKDLHSEISKMAYEDLVRLADDLDEEDVDAVMEGADMNIAMARYGLSHEVGLGMGKTIKDASKGAFETDLPTRIRALCSAAADGRMDGVALPVMSSAGSGNHGITAILPVYILGEFYKKPKKAIASAIAFSHLSTSYIKSRMGRLSPVCGCAVAAGAGAASGMVKLLGGSVKEAEHAMEIVIGGLVGMVCDGAKETCALKVGAGASEAYFAALAALDGKALKGIQGVVDGSDISKTVDNAVELNAVAMKAVDSAVIDMVSRGLASL